MVDVSGALKNPGSVFPFREVLSFDPCEVIGEELTFTDAVLEGEFFGADETISVRARLTANVHAHCSRCLSEVTYPVDTMTDADFSRSDDGEDVYTFTGHQIDVKQAAFESLLLELPISFVCSEDCKGLCPVCGVNRNKSLCTCLEGAVKPNPFSALTSLLIEDHNEEE